MRTPAPSLLIPMTADVAGLEIARLQARQFLQNNAVDEHALTAVELVLEEAITNVIRYGYEGQPPRAEPPVIEIDLQIELDEVQIVIVDDAKPFDPLDSGGLLLPETLDDAQVGGLGLLMIRNTATHMAYERRDGQNRFTLTVQRH